MRTTVEILRVATDGVRNGCSFLYAACCHAATALGYLVAVTYTKADEPGTSLVAAGFERAADVAAGEWDRPSRPRPRQGVMFGLPVREAVDRVRWQRRLRPA